MKRGMRVGVFVLIIATASPGNSASPPTVQAQLAKVPPEMRQTVSRFSPELQAKFFALSPEIRAKLGRLDDTKTRHSKTLTLRQVMQEILSDLQDIVAAVATDNAEQAADSAHRLADHRIPMGGLLPYLPLDKINDQTLGVLPAMDDAVEGAALRLAKAADRGDMGAVATQVGEIAGGCVACHKIFRGQPGVSTLLTTSPPTK